jgi:class 3 adenylate cyclase
VSGRGPLVNEALARENENLREQQRALGGVLRTIARAEGLQAVLDEILMVATRLCGGDYGALLLPEGEVFRVFSHFGDPEEARYDRDHPHTRDRTTCTGRVALSHEVVHIPDVLADPEYSWPTSATGQAKGDYRTILGVPILIDDQLIGVINVVRRAQDPFTEEQIELVHTFADQAAVAIANARLIDAVERQRTELSRFVAPQVADLVSSDKGETLLAGHRAYITCLFCDLRGFTAFAETAAPEELFEVLREYHRTLGALIAECEGTLEHFAGDGVMVFFNDPTPVRDHELKAIRFALAAHAQFRSLAQAWRRRGIELGLGVGISAGYATLGRIGFEGRYDYGALGPDTSLASRLSSQAKPGQTLISQRVNAAVEAVFETEPIGELRLKGFGRPVTAYEVRGVLS